MFQGISNNTDFLLIFNNRTLISNHKPTNFPQGLIVTSREALVVEDSPYNTLLLAVGVKASTSRV